MVMVNHMDTIYIYSLRGGYTDTHMHTNMHTDFADNSNFKKPGMCLLKGAPGLINGMICDFA